MALKGQNYTLYDQLTASYQGLTITHNLKETGMDPIIQTSIASIWDNLYKTLKMLSNKNARLWINALCKMYGNGLIC